jgi:hypothetical protein
MERRREERDFYRRERRERGEGKEEKLWTGFTGWRGEEKRGEPRKNTKGH